MIIYNGIAYRTYDEWQNLGYQVREGEKSHRRTFEGQALFSEQQVDSDESDWDDFGLDPLDFWGD